MLANDPHPPSDAIIGARIEANGVVAAAAIMLAGVAVGRGAVLGANAVAAADVPRGRSPWACPHAWSETPATSATAERASQPTLGRPTSTASTARGH